MDLHLWFWWSVTYRRFQNQFHEERNEKGESKQSEGMQPRFLWKGSTGKEQKPNQSSAQEIQKQGKPVFQNK